MSSRNTINTYAMVGAATLLALPAMAAGDNKYVSEDGSPHGQKQPLELLTNLIFWEVVSFVLLFVILSVAVFPKMFGAMKNRQTRIEEALAKAKKVNEEADALFKKHEKMMSEAHAEAKKISDDAIAAGEKARAEMIDAAKNEAAEIVERSKKEIELAQSKAMDELRASAVDLSLAASSAVLKRSVTDDDHRRLAEEAISAFESRN